MNKKIIIPLSIILVIASVASFVLFKFKKLNLQLDSSKIYKIEYSSGYDEEKKEVIITNKSEISKVTEYLNNFKISKTYERTKCVVETIINFKDEEDKIIRALHFKSCGTLITDGNKYNFGSENLKELKELIVDIKTK